MNTIWIICGSFLIGTAIGNRTTTSTIPPTSASDLHSSSLTTESTSKSRRSLQSFDHYDFTPTSRLIVPSTSSFSPRISIVDSASNNPYKYLDTSFTNNFPIHNVDHPKLSTIQPIMSGHASHFDASSGFKLIPDGPKLSATNSFPATGAANYHPTLSPMNIRHLVTLGTINSGETHPIYSNKFENVKFPRLNTRPLSTNIGSPITRNPINYSPTYPDIKSIKHNPTFVSPSLTNTGNFVPINLEQLQTSHGIPERIRADDIESKPNYPTFNKPNLYLPSIDNFQVNPVNLPAAPYLYPNISAAENYQLFSAQPQLHFYANSQQPIYQPQPFERIRTDVEVINKKRPSISPPIDDDNSGYNDSSEGENTGTKQHDILKNQQATNYQVPNSPVFNSYDAAFGKYSKLSPDLPKKEKLIEKPERYNPNADEEPEKHVYELQSDDGASPGSRENYEYESEGESAPRERSQRDYNDNDGYNDEFAHFDSYGKDFNHDFEKSYQRKIPTEEFSHNKEVPDIEESVNKEKIVSREENKRGSRHTTITTPIRKEFGYRISRQNHTRNEPTERSIDTLTINKHESEKNTQRTPIIFHSSNSNRKTSSNAPINGIKSLKRREFNPYVHQGGIKIINPPILPTLPPM